MQAAHNIKLGETDALSCICPECDCTIVEELYENSPDTVELYCKSCRQGFLFKLTETGEYVYGGH